MKELRTTYPYGLNDKCNGRIWKNKNQEDITASIFNPIKCLMRKKRTRNYKHAWSQAFSFVINIIGVINFMIVGFFSVEKVYVHYPKKF